MCDLDLLFLYVAVTAPGKTNNARACYRCNDLIQWLEALPEEYCSIGDNAYPLSLRMLIPFNKAEICLLYTSPSPRDLKLSRMPSSA